MADNRKDISGKTFEESIKEQNYTQLWESCMQEKAHFRDALFAHEKNGEYFTRGQFANKTIEWKRPFSITSEPRFIDGQQVDRDGISQGHLSDCWLISAISTLTLKPKLFHKVVPMQSFHTEYAGIFRFHFYQYGEWISVVIDDYLPTLDDRLIFAHSKKGEFWLALLEKAYAKLNGGYETLNGGNSSEAFVDLTGGVAETFIFNSSEDDPADLFAILYRYHLRNSLMCAYIHAKGERGTKFENGLILKHEYSLTGMCRLNIKGKVISLVRLRNPWGRGEWNGPWSDHSSEWNSVSQEDKKKVGLNLKDDGEFWMPYNDFIRYFNVFECCHVLGAHHDDGYMWHAFELSSAWDSGNAGGCINHTETFRFNPKFLLTITASDADNDQDDNRCTVVISLLQKFFRFRLMVHKEFVRVGFVIFRYADLSSNDKENTLVEVKPHQIGSDFFKNNVSVGRTDFVEKRGVSGRYRLQLGQYLIVPSTFEPRKEVAFMLRVLISKSTVGRGAFLEKHSVKFISTPNTIQTPHSVGQAAKVSPKSKTFSGSNSKKKSAAQGSPSGSNGKKKSAAQGYLKAGANFKFQVVKKVDKRNSRSPNYNAKK